MIRNIVAGRVAPVAGSSELLMKAAGMTRDEALKHLSQLAHAKAFGWHVGSDRLIDAALDVLLAGVESPTVALLAGLGRNEEPEAPELFDALLDELSLRVQLPTDPEAKKWTMAYWLAGRIVDGSIDPAAGANLIWVEVADELGHPAELQPFVECVVNLDSWDESWPVSVAALKEEAIEAARELLNRRSRQE
jgi:hypothetical protein